MQPTSAAPNVPLLMQALAAHDVAYVVAGSVAAQLHGVALEPRDFDVVPALTPENLARLAQVLRDVEACLSDIGQVGAWQEQADGEMKWVSREATPEERRQRAAWRPRADNIASLDDLFHTRFGNLDVVPVVAGRYEDLVRRARRVRAYGCDVRVAHVDDLLAALTVPRRARDTERVRQLRALQRGRP